jgi:Leucine-rich repeat (LRR) protein
LEKKLKWLIVNKTNLNNLPSSLEKLQDLEILQIDNNKLEFIPEIVFELTSLKNLAIHKNNLREIPIEVERLKKLEWLSFANNNIVE